jgi:hypothetical protein
MRKLKTSDIPAFCRCLKKLGVKDKIQTVAKEANNVRDVWDQGFDLIWGIFDLATEADGENALYSFLAGPFEMTPQDVANLDLEALFANMQQLAEENNLLHFFKFAAKSMRSN